MKKTLRILTFLASALLLVVASAWRMVDQTSGTVRAMRVEQSYGTFWSSHRQTIGMLLVLLLVVLAVSAFLLFQRKVSCSLLGSCRNRKWTLRLVPQNGILILVLSAAVCLLQCTSAKIGVADYLRDMKNLAWCRENPTVAHAFGAVDGKTYTNSLDAFYQNYEKGHRVFEVDLSMTADGATVCAHDWEHSAKIQGFSEGYVPTAAEFRQTPIYETYQAATFADLLLLMQQYPDIYIVTDSKYSDTQQVLEEFRDMVNTAQALDCQDVLDRLIIQIYNDAMLDTVRSVYPFSHFFYTIYQRGFSGMEDMVYLSQFCAENGVEAITMWASLWDPDYAAVAEAYGIAVYVHTVNDQQEAQRLVSSGVTGVYTDYLLLR